MTNWIITSSVLILIMIAARSLFKGHISPLLQYALWLIVLVRLVVPFNPLESPISVLNAVPTSLSAASGVTKNTENLTPETFTASPAADYTAADSATADSAVAHTETDIFDAPKITTSVPAQSGLLSFSFVLGTLWLTGTAALLIYALIRNYRLARFLHRTRRPYADGVYVAPALPSSCLFGVLKPTIYITEAVACNRQSRRHVLAHEQAHRRHGDHIWNLLRIVVLALHWYNPLVWWACALSKRDAEMAADTAAIAALAPQERFDYGETLLNMLDFAAPRDTWFSCSTTMITTKRALRERINAIVKNAHTAVSMAVIVLMMAIAVVGCTFTGAEDEDVSSSTDSDTAETSFNWYEYDLDGRERVDVIAGWLKEDHSFTHVEISDTLGEWINDSDLLNNFEVTDYYMLEMSDGSMLGCISYVYDPADDSQYQTYEQFLTETASSMNLENIHLGWGMGADPEIRTGHFAFDKHRMGKYYTQYRAGTVTLRYLTEIDPRVTDPLYTEPVLNYYQGEPSSSRGLVDFYIKCVVEDFNLTYEDASEKLLQLIHDSGFTQDDLIDTYYMAEMSDGTYVGTIILDPSVTSVPPELDYDHFAKEQGLVAEMPSGINPNEIFFFLYPTEKPLEEVPFLKVIHIQESIKWVNKHPKYMTD